MFLNDKSFLMAFPADKNINKPLKNKELLEKFIMFSQVDTERNVCRYCPS